MEKRVVFQNRWLPYLLVAPQLAITLIFFFLPAGQAIYQSVLMQDPFGLSTEFVGLQNFETLLSDPNYVSSFKITMVFSALVAFLGLAISLLLAVCADRVLRGRLGLQDLPHRAVRRRPRRGGRPLDVHLQSDARRSLLRDAHVRHRLELSGRRWTRP